MGDYPVSTQCSDSYTALCRVTLSHRYVAEQMAQVPYFRFFEMFQPQQRYIEQVTSMQRNQIIARETILCYQHPAARATDTHTR